jgi:programmed cell death protein 5
MSEEGNELEEIRQRKLLELRQRLGQEQQQAQLQQQVEATKQAILRRILEQKARQRLNNLKIVKPEFTNQLEVQLIQLVQSGKVGTPITDEVLKEILIRLQSQRRDIKIMRR